MHGSFAPRSINIRNSYIIHIIIDIIYGIFFPIPNRTKDTSKQVRKGGKEVPRKREPRDHRGNTGSIIGELQIKVRK